MTARKLLYAGLALIGAIAFSRAKAETKSPLETVPSVDLKRYGGRWFEIAKYPNRFEKKCDRDTTATYTLRDDGKIDVLNACITRDGKRSEAKGWAKVVDSQTGAKLKVTFFWPFFGNYWIIDLGPNYEYAVIGEPTREYLWILSRTPSLDEATYREITSRLAHNGYDASKLERMSHTGARQRPLGFAEKRLFTLRFVPHIIVSFLLCLRSQFIGARPCDALLTRLHNHSGET